LIWLLWCSAFCELNYNIFGRDMYLPLPNLFWQYLRSSMVTPWCEYHLWFRTTIWVRKVSLCLIINLTRIFIFYFYFQVEKVLTGYPADYAGLKPHDFLVSVQGQEIFDFCSPRTSGKMKILKEMLNKLFYFSKRLSINSIFFFNFHNAAREHQEIWRFWKKYWINCSISQKDWVLTQFFSLIFIMRPVRPCFQAPAARETLWVWDPCFMRSIYKKFKKIKK